ncbi:hypothetical protein KCTC32516_01007 [Polaribacter huanghezhanensis]|uniref:hypothetical protein n=1 Tax=Polaribacter huanghezhanensis TaxID=1354726 RepID=UPI0026482A5F|nr:hypothetical protein [Polaribacter huanghezhanensis]WKD85664.1 hypothetical protein KCTC32516_01007 [Polaribacter huanghezhanensis]
MMKSILITLLFITSIAFSQVNQINNLRDVYTLKNDIDAKYNNQNDPSVKGSPFIHLTYQNIKIKGVKMKGKYNANLDYIKVDNNGEIILFIPSVEHRYDVVFTDDNATYRAFEYENLKFGFFKILAKKEKTFLLGKQFIKFYPKVKPKNNFDLLKPARFQRKKDTYYIKLSNQDIIVELPTRKSKFLKVFASKSNVVKHFIKKEKLNFKKEKDLIKIFNFYTSLN